MGKLVLKRDKDRIMRGKRILTHFNTLIED